MAKKTRKRRRKLLLAVKPLKPVRLQPVRLKPVRLKAPRIGRVR